jgi:hypothetical protein
MRKLRLDLDALQVDSFAVEPDRAPSSGTVHGHATGYEATCAPCDTQQADPFAATLVTCPPTISDSADTACANCAGYTAETC